MKCYFCNNYIGQNDVHQMQGYPPMKIGDCRQCKSEIVIATTVIEEARIISAHLYVLWGDDRYQVILHIRKNYFAINHVNAPHAKEEIYRSSHIPDINFDNVLTKLPIYLTFL